MPMLNQLFNSTDTMLDTKVDHKNNYGNRRKLIQQQKQKFSEKRKQSASGLFESQSVGMKKSDKASAMDWANSETDHFVSINKLIFNHHDETD